MEQNASIVHDGTVPFGLTSAIVIILVIRGISFMNFENLQFADELLTCG